MDDKICLFSLLDLIVRPVFSSSNQRIPFLLKLKQDMVYQLNEITQISTICVQETKRNEMGLLFKKNFIT